MFYIQPTLDDVARAIESWHWLDLESKQPILVTAFGDIFFTSDDGVWFLDTMEGTLTRVCETRAELEAILGTEDGENHYLFAGFVERAKNDGMPLSEGQCYDFKLNPVVGGAIAYENIEPRDFVVAVNLAGQLHKQVRNMPKGTRISGFSIANQSE
jgi:hypothetical protein